jgi:chemosensory pili system protein ChpA (sensor histidine kinase/response regulator)
MAKFDKVIIAGFHEEAKGYLPKIRACLETLRADPSQLEAMEEAHRLVHSIKGAASMVGLSALSEVAYAAEETLEDVASGKLSMNAEMATVLNQTVSHIESYLDHAVGTSLSEPPLVAEVVKAFRRLHNLPQSGDQGEIESLAGDADAEMGLEAPTPKSTSGDETPPAEEPAASDLDEQVSSDLIEAFQVEAEQYLETIAQSLREIEENPENRGALQEVRRAVHTVKGAAGMVGLSSAHHLAHRMEDLLDRLYEQAAAVSGLTLNLCFDTADLLVDMISAQGVGENFQPRAESLYERYSSVLESDAPGLAHLADQLEQPTGSGHDSDLVLEPVVSADDVQKNFAAEGAAHPEDEVSSELVEAFQVEAEQYLETIARRLREIEDSPENREALQEVRRTVHTLKGAAGMVGLGSAHQLAHRMEDLLDRLYEQASAVAGPTLNLLFDTADLLGDMVERIDTEDFRPRAEDLCGRYIAVLDRDPSGKAHPSEELEEPSRLGEGSDLVKEPAALEHSAQEDLPVKTGSDLEEDVSPELVEAFQVEAEQYLETIARRLREIEDSPENREALQEVRRTVHTLKGAAGMVGLSSAHQLAHRMEDLLDRLYEEAAEVAGPTLKLLFETADILEDMIGEKVEEDDLQPRLEDLYGDYKAVIESHSSGHPQVADALEQPSCSEESPDLDPPLAPEPLAFGASAQEDHPADVASNLDEQVSPELVEAFQVEAQQYLETMARLLRHIEESPEDREALQEVRRAVHTLKGAAGMVGLSSAHQLAHRMEDLLDRLYEEATAVSGPALKLVFDTADVLDVLVSENAGGESVQPRVDDLYERYNTAMKDNSPGPAPADYESEAPSTPAASEPAAESPPELLDTFKSECADAFETISSHLRDLEQQPENRTLIEEVRRTVHTIKGASATVGHREVSRLAHRMEDLLEQVHGGGIQLSKDIRDLLFLTADSLEDMVSGDLSSAELRRQLGQLYASYSAVLGAEESASPLGGAHPEPDGTDSATPAIDISSEAPQSTEQTPAPKETPGAAYAPGQFVRVPLERLDELVRLVSELVVNRSTFEQSFRKYAYEVDELDLSLQRLRRISTKVETEYEVSALIQGQASLTQLPGMVDVGPPLTPVSHTSAGRQAEFDSLEFDRYSEFHLLSRDLAETVSDIGSVGNRFGVIIDDFDTSLSRLGQLSSTVQDRLMRLRMVPLASLATRLHRTVRVTAGKQDKLAQLTIEGESVELDKTVLEEIVGPLEHLLRNAVDHGVEPPALRTAIGKEQQGQIRLRAYYEGTQVVIQISDDGAGLESDTLRSRALSLGFLGEAEAAALTDEEAYSLVFQPGFSTAQTVTEVSGRGVGLDIAKSAVARMKGVITADSVAGSGVTFTIRLPMTLAITRVLLVGTCGETLAVPLNAVTQILRIDPSQVERIGQKEVIRLQDRVLPLLRLGEALSLPNPPDSTIQKPPVLILQLGDRRLALAVDRLIEAREVVVKTLGNVLRRVHGVTGATLMGDGRVVLIVNPSDLVDEPTALQRPSRSAGRTTPSQAAAALDVLVVDDSVSVRRVLANLLKSVGWNPIGAKDGVEALEILQTSAKKPDVVLLDVEMPRMDGYELTATLRGQQAYQRLPIVMLTSRAGKKHRDKAFQLGATDYLVKPYQEDTLLSVVRRVVGEARGAEVE